MWNIVHLMGMMVIQWILVYWKYLQWRMQFRRGDLLWDGALWQSRSIAEKRGFVIVIAPRIMRIQRKIKPIRNELIAVTVWWTSPVPNSLTTRPVLREVVSKLDNLSPDSSLFLKVLKTAAGLQMCPINHEIKFTIFMKLTAETSCGNCSPFGVQQISSFL